MLNNVIKEARIRRNLKQEEVAEFVNVTVQTYSKWENGKTEPKASQVSKLSEILKVSEKEICNGKLSARYELEIFMREISNIYRGTDGFNQLIATWNTCDHTEFLDNLKEQCELDEEHKGSFGM
jgi:transcriptional regulator with XRE-family HTH domain